MMPAVQCVILNAKGKRCGRKDAVVTRVQLGGGHQWPHDVCPFHVNRIAEGDQLDTYDGHSVVGLVSEDPAPPAETTTTPELVDQEDHHQPPEPTTEPEPDSELWDELEAAPELWGEIELNSGAPSAADLEDLESKAAALGLDPVGRREGSDPPPSGAARATLEVSGSWSPARVRVYLQLLSAQVERMGKEPLTRAEIQEGGDVLAPVCQDLFGNIEGKWTAAFTWCAFTFGSRFLPELQELVRRAIRALRPRPTVTPPRPAGPRRPRPMEPEDLEPGGRYGDGPGPSGWGRPSGNGGAE